MHLLPNYDELLIRRAGNGVRLVNPEAVQMQETDCSLGDIFNESFSVYFLNTDSIVQRANESVAAAHHFLSPREMVGKSVFDLYETTSAYQARINDLYVMQNDMVKITEELADLQDSKDHFSNLTIEAPWYDERQHIQGVFGCSIILGQHALDKALRTISNLGLLEPGRGKCSKFNKHHIHGVPVTPREMTCLYAYVRGKSARLIAEQLNISRRTVEHHLENLRRKFNAKNKAELIEMVIDTIK